VDLESIRDLIQGFYIDHDIPFFVLGKRRFLLQTAAASSSRVLFFPVLK
jgi:hypothetical protein